MILFIVNAKHQFVCFVMIIIVIDRQVLCGNKINQIGIYLYLQFIYHNLSSQQPH